MRWECRAGTPSAMKVKAVDTETQIRGWMRSQMAPHLKFAGKVAKDVEKELLNARMEMDGSVVYSQMKRNEVRRWQVEDPVSKVKFTYEIERIA